ncbi:MmgE/PrpD family protein (plasmid) [Variovorax sp. WDL1]|nr:MmgE/PrpD [Variovorax sp. WDL1]PNG46073.1 hypothetical protein CHC06_08051 [Variovorax sp. B2]PNG46268.1 hypothetical protein CHC07_08016 [Variovorax sp. B4]VTV19183.1 MmgE/PrpD family protein [Variovorax sp. WDL1]
MTDRPGEQLAAFAAELAFDTIPDAAVRRAEDLFLDWSGSVLAGRNAPPVRAILDVARAIAPAGGQAEILINRGSSSPAFAALVNAAASHVGE